MKKKMVISYLISYGFWSAETKIISILCTKFLLELTNSTGQFLCIPYLM